MADKRRLEDLAKLSDYELYSTFELGTTPDFDSLKGFEFRGFNTPAFAKLIGIQKFVKGFFTKSGQAYGYNCPIVQNGITGEWVHKPTPDNPKRFGFYTVKPVDKSSKENKHPSSLLLNYGEGGNPLLNFTWVLRDYVVQVDADNPDLYLGLAYIALGPARIKSNFFILDRLRESTLVEQ